MWLKFLKFFWIIFFSIYSVSLFFFFRDSCYLPRFSLCSSNFSHNITYPFSLLILLLFLSKICFFHLTFNFSASSFVLCLFTLVFLLLSFSLVTYFHWFQICPCHFISEIFLIHAILLLCVLTFTSYLLVYFEMVGWSIFYSTS